MKDKEFEEIDAMLQEKYPILWRPHFDEKYHKFNDEYTIYLNWGFEGLSVVWLKQLIEPMMPSMTAWLTLSSFLHSVLAETICGYSFEFWFGR